MSIIVVVVAIYLIKIIYAILNCFICSDGERLTIELGRALRSGEYKCKVYYMKLSEVNDTSETLTFLCDWILCNGASVGKTKREILAQISSNNPQYEIPYERCRLRKKSTFVPGKIFLDDQVFGDDIILLPNYEVYYLSIEYLNWIFFSLLMNE